jgi:hypothetical protein
MDLTLNNESNFTCVLPNEIMFIILSFCNIRLLKKIRFMKEFKYLVKEIDKYIKKRNNEIEDRNYWKLLYYEQFRNKLINCIENSELSLRIDSHRWSEKMIDCTNMCIQFNNEIVKQISKKEKLERLILNNYNACEKLEFYYEEYNNYKDKWKLFEKKDEEILWFNTNTIHY